MKDRHSIRLRDYDYSQSGAYFVMICTYNKECLFGQVVDGKMVLNDARKMIFEEWQELAVRFPYIELDECMIMPNHFHGIVIVGATLVVAQINTVNTERAGTRPAPTRKTTIGDIVGAFKSITTDQYIDGVKTRNWQPFNGKLWQRNYYEHVIRNENDLNQIRQYIIDNPAKWDLDEENPDVRPAKS